MSLFNLIWIVAFLYYGFRLTFTGITGINFGAWDEIIGVVLLLTAGFGLYFVVITAVKKITGILNRLKRRNILRSSRQNLETAPAPDGFLGDFRPDVMEDKPEGPFEPLVIPPVEEAEDEYAQADSEIQEAEERLKRLREEFSLDKF